MPPNVLWVVLEDVSPRLGCYGDPLANTPRIDAFAEGARRYNFAYSTTGTCAPSRASLVTGMAPQTLGAHHMRTETHAVDGLPAPYRCVPPHYVTAIPEQLRAAGYYCTLDRKTDYQFGEPPTMWDHHGAGAGWWDDDRDRGQPFFAMMTNGVTHESGMWPPGSHEAEREGGRVETVPVDPDAVSVPPYLIDDANTRASIARQYANLATLDEWVGGLLDRLAADGHAANTCVMLVGDHGEGLPRKKRWPYEGGTHVPLLVRWPGEIEGGSTSRLVSGVDIGPSTLSIAGVDPPAYLHGRPFLGPNEEPPRREVVTTRDRIDESYDMIRAVRDRRFRYVRNYYPGRPYVQHVPYRDRHPAMQALLAADARDHVPPSARGWLAGRRPAEELYDLRRDPHELDNLAGDADDADVLERLRAALATWRRGTGDVRFGAERESHMRTRMWQGDERPRTAAPQFVVHGPAGALAPGDRDGGPVRVSLYCPTQGASLSWSVDGESWELYGGPIRLTSGTYQLAARAVRYGYEPSTTVERRIEVT